VYVEKLVCSKCKTSYLPEENPLMCKRRDFGRLDIVYDYDAISDKFNRTIVRSKTDRDVWRYEELLPVSSEFSVRLGEGGTPLIHAKRLGEKLGTPNLFLKDETRNPSASFKDRAMAVGLAKAREIQRRDVVTASSGNAAASLAAYSAVVGIRCHAFVPEDASKAKIAQLLLYGADVTRCRQLKEGEDPTVQMMISTVDTLGYYSCPSFGPFNPYQVEGPKTITYELFEQLNWEELDAIFIPTGSCCLLTGIWKGLEDFNRLDLIESNPRLVAVQPSGNSAFVRAVSKGEGTDQVVPEAYPASVASGLLDPYPWDGDAGMVAIRKTGGAGISVSDENIMQAVRELAAYEGIFAEPSGAAGLAGLEKMIENELIGKNDTMAVLVTGSGLKEPDKIAGMYPEPRLVDSYSEWRDSSHL
jgi:threonine synthase